MKQSYTRRDFTRLAGIGALASPTLFAADSASRRIKIGHTGITWGEDSLQAVKAFEHKENGP
jgi:hypothetical protein